MSKNVEVVADTQLQILRSRITGNCTVKEMDELVAQTTIAIQLLDDPEDVYVLSDGRNLKLVDISARQMMIDNLKRSGMTRYAVWGATSSRALFMRILFKVAGIHKIRFFTTEKAALAWLLKNR